MHQNLQKTVHMNLHDENEYDLNEQTYYNQSSFKK